MASAQRDGRGASRFARERASLTERTEEIRLHASRIPQRCEACCDVWASKAATISLLRRSVSASVAAASECGATERYSGPPTKKAILCGGFALRISVQNLSRFSASPVELISTRLYKSARHQHRASSTSAAQSTSMPSLLITSARKSRLTCDVSNSSTRFFLARLLSADESGSATAGAVMLLSL